MWILCINLQKYVKIDPKMLKNDGLERSWRHLGPMLALKGVKMSFGRLPGRFLVLFWAVKAPFRDPFGSIFDDFFCVISRSFFEFVF